MSSRFERADLEGLLHDLERRFARLGRVASRAASASPQTAERIGDTIISALGDVVQRFGTRARAVGGDAGQLGDEALEFGNEALRKLTREVDRKPLIMLAVAVGVGALAAGLLARR